MRVIGFNRVELVVAEDQIGQAAKQFNEALGTHLGEAIPVDNRPVLSTTVFDGNIELVAPVGGEGPFGAKLSQHGPGQIGPLVWEVESVDDAKAYLGERGLRIVYEYDSSAGTGAETEMGVRQLILDPGQWFGFSVTLMERKG